MTRIQIRDAPQIIRELRMGLPTNLKAFWKFCQNGGLGSAKKSVLISTVGFKDILIIIRKGKKVASSSTIKSARLMKYPGVYRLSFFILSYPPFD